VETRIDNPVTAIPCPSNQATARFRDRDSPPDTNPHSSFWDGAPSVIAQANTFGDRVPELRTEVLAQWTPDNLYFLFICPYHELNLKPAPTVLEETYKLWNWDVAEVFIGSDFANIRRYKEFEVSPQGEWVDLDIDLDSPHPEDGWIWKSGLEAGARIEPIGKLWYGFMRIPYSSIDNGPAVADHLLRINFYRSQGPKSNYKEIAWQPTFRETFHAPEVFGTLRLLKDEQFGFEGR
jgi:hypothetical protein